MKSINQKYEIKAPVSEVWQALVNPKIIADLGAGPAKMNEKVGTKFSLWGGDIYGKNIEVVKEKKLVQEWFGGKWEKPSILTLILIGKEGVTELDLIQTDVPNEEVKDISQGWKDYYIGPMIEMLQK